MVIAKLIAGILICLAAAFSGGIFGMYVGGLDICGAESAKNRKATKKNGK